MVAGIIGSPIGEGRTYSVFDSVQALAGSETTQFNLEADGILVAVYVESLSGTLDVQVDTIGDDGQLKSAIAFPQFNAASSELTIKTAVNVLSRIRITVTYSGSCQYRVWARGIGRGGTLSDDASASGNDLAALTVTNPTVTNVTLGSAGTEQSISLPANSKRVYLKTPEDAVLQFTYSAGQSAVGIPIPMGCSYLEQTIARPSTTLYVQSNKTGTKVKVLSWT